MKAIIIGAGRGSRLGSLTEELPKPLVPIRGRAMLDRILDGLRGAGLAGQDVVYVCGYRGEVLRARHPELCFVENAAWERNNILASLLCAREHMAGGFVSTYADIVYRPSIVAELCESPHDIVLGCDTDWRARYVGRSQHPETDAEKMRLDGDRVLEVHRDIPSEAAHGEFIGVMKVSAKGVERLLAAYDEARALRASPFRSQRPFEKAYLIELLEWMVSRGEPLHAVRMDGGYMEIDTEEDARLADLWWDQSPMGHTD